MYVDSVVSEVCTLGDTRCLGDRGISCSIRSGSCSYQQFGHTLTLVLVPRQKQVSIVKQYPLRDELLHKFELIFGRVPKGAGGGSRFQSKNFEADFFSNFEGEKR